MSAAVMSTKVVSREFLLNLAKERYGDMVKAVIDLKRGIIAMGTQMHADAQQMLLEQGSMQEDLWGVNIYAARLGDEMIEVDSMINLRPWQNNRSRDIDDSELRSRVVECVQKFVLP